MAGLQSRQHGTEARGCGQRPAGLFPPGNAQTPEAQTGFHITRIF